MLLSLVIVISILISSAWLPHTLFAGRDFLQGRHVVGTLIVLILFGPIRILELLGLPRKQGPITPSE